MAPWHRSKAAPFGVSAWRCMKGPSSSKARSATRISTATRLCASATCRSSTSNSSTARRFQLASASRRPPLSLPPSATRSSPPWELGCATCPCVRPRCARRSRVTAERNDVRSTQPRQLGDFVAIHQLVTDAHHISSLLQDVCGFRAFGRDGGREAITTPRNIDDETVAVHPILECPT